jgi:hypothetical protein
LFLYHPVLFEDLRDPKRSRRLGTLVEELWKANLSEILQIGFGSQVFFECFSQWQKLAHCFSDEISRWHLELE